MARCKIAFNDPLGRRLQEQRGQREQRGQGEQERPLLFRRTYIVHSDEKGFERGQQQSY